MGGVPGWIRVPGLALTGVALGWLGGLLWRQAYGPPYGDFGSGGEGWAEAFRGTLGGGLTGVLFGWLSARAPTRRIGLILLLLLGSIAAAVLLVVGVSYIGDWTNADGPVGFAPYVGVPGILPPC